MAKKRINITLNEDTKERLLQYAFENHIDGGLSGTIEYLAWHVAKIKNAQIKGQISLNDGGNR